MRHFHVLRNREHCPIVNLDKLWSMLPEGTMEQTKEAGGKAPVIDVTESVSICGVTIPQYCPAVPTRDDRMQPKCGPLFAPGARVYRPIGLFPTRSFIAFSVCWLFYFCVEPP